MDLMLFAQAGCAIFVAAVFRGFSGFGFALAAVPFMGLLLPPLKAVPIVILLQFVAGVSDSRAASKSCDWRSLRWLVLGALVGSPLGTLILANVSASSARLAIGLSTLCAVAALAKGQLLTHATTRASSFGYGVVAGIFNGLAAMPGPAAVTHYMASRMEDKVVRASLIMFFFFTSIIALTSLVVLDKIDREILIVAAAGVPALWGGTAFGKYLFNVKKGVSYRTVSLVLLSCVAALAIADALHEMAV